ncbi:MAG: hypothetical protein M3T56_20020 [Chloroflexota bacterium]|nr:hypothetical protein [Chloroflexota bacterium]
MRRRIALALVVAGLLLIGLSFVEPPVTDASRPNLLYVGIGVLLLGLATATLRRGPRREIDVSAGGARHAAAADVSVLEPPPAPVAPPRADVTLRVDGNGASDPSVRWYHVAATTGTDVAARKAHLGIAVRGEQAGTGWQWQTGDRAVDLTQAGSRIPIVIGGVRESVEPIGPGWVVPFKNWYLTPNAVSAVGPFLAPFIAGFRHIFDVTVRWDERGIAQSSSASFELRFWGDPTSEPRFIRIGDRPSYRDQAGGLGELRDRGTALRKEGMMLPLTALGAWLGRVVSWTGETRSLIAEVSTADGDYFWALKAFNAPLFEGVRLHDDRHRQALRELHERLIRLQFFMRPAGTPV